MQSTRREPYAPKYERQPRSIARLCQYFACFTFIVIFNLSPAVADEEATKTTFNIEAQSADRSLTLFARQAKVQLGFAADIVEDIFTNPVMGEFENAQALRLLLKDTGLKAEYGERGIIIRRDVTHKIRSDVSAPPSTSGKSNDLQLTKKESRSSIAPAVDRRRKEKNASEKLPEIVVTGSRIRRARNAAPVLTISRSDIDAAGFATIGQLIESLPQNFGGGANQENFSDSFGPAYAVTRQFTGTEVSINLRGLGPGSTLVLLNGRRLAPGGLAGGFVDISSIPLTAVKRVEVLTGGASAIYGADAIAGVVNFILLDDYDGAETSLRYSPDVGTDTSDTRFSQVFGEAWSSGNLLIAYEYYDQDNLDTADRAQAADSDLTSLGGDNFSQIGGNPGTVNAGGVFYAIPSEQDGTSLSSADFVAGTQNLKNKREGLDLRGEQHRHSLFVNIRQEMSDAAEVFLETRYSTVDANIRTFQSPRDLTVPETNPFFVDPTGTGLPAIRIENYSLIPDIGPTVTHSKVNTYGAAAGIESDFGSSWEASLSGTIAQEETSTTDRNKVNVDALNAALGQSDPQLAFNPFADGSNTNAAVLGNIRAGGDGVDLKQEVWSLNIDVGGNVFNLPGGPVGVATGLELRRESIEGVTRELTDAGSISVIPGIKRDREILAAYGELFFPLVGDANELPGVRRLELSLAARNVDYDDFGTSTNPKLGLMWSPIQALVLKGTIGTSFKPPLLTQLDTSDPRENVDGYIGSTPVPAIFRFGGNEELLAEESTSWTAGLQFAPKDIPGLTIDVTYFDIVFENRIQLPPGGLFDVFNPEFSVLVDRSPSREEIVAIANSVRWRNFGTSAEDVIDGVVPVGAIVDKRMRNIATSKVSGVDLQAAYDIASEAGEFSFGLNGSYLIDNSAALLTTLPSVELVDTVSNPVALRIRASASWSRGGWGASSFVNYTGSYTDNQSNPQRSIDSWTTIDLHLSYEAHVSSSWLNDVRLSVTVQNLFDEDPPFVNRNFGMGFDPANASIFGRYVSLQAAKSWHSL